jgi:hypothetical protein
MLKKIDKSQYYQRDYYKPRSGVPHARKGEINPAAEKAAQELKDNIDKLVRDPRWETSSEYRDEVKKYFKGHFSEKDEYYSRTGTVNREAGEIKVPRSETKPKWYGPDGYIELKDGNLYTPKGIYYASSKNKWSGPGGYITLSGGNLFAPGGGIYYPSN